MTRHLLSFGLARRIWSARRDSNSRIEFGRLACFRLHHFRVSLPIFNCQFPIGAVQPKTVSTHTKMPSQKDQSALGNWQSEMLWNSWQDLNQQPRRTTTPARLPRWGPRFRSVALFHLSYRSRDIADFRLLIADLNSG